ncbi:hypothetical protein TNCV_1239721 [Trichonephila clavipes]|nr:hypothetical protein TNCV_1239721 [Trichonephila clavipes]
MRVNKLLLVILWKEFRGSKEKPCRENSHIWHADDALAPRLMKPRLLKPTLPDILKKGGMELQTSGVVKSSGTGHKTSSWRLWSSRELIETKTFQQIYGRKRRVTFRCPGNQPSGGHLNQTMQITVKESKKDIMSLKENNRVSAESLIKAINPFLDKDGKRRVGGRLCNSGD